MLNCFFLFLFVCFKLTQWRRFGQDGVVDVPLGASLDITFETEKRAHQSVAILSSEKLGLDISYPAQVKVSGKGKLTIPYKNIPEVFLSSSTGDLKLELAIGNFGTEEESSTEDEDTVKITQESVDSVLLTITDHLRIQSPVPRQSPYRFGAKPEIHHQFRGDPRQVNRIFAAVFAAGIMFSANLLFNAWTLIAKVDMQGLSPAFSSHGIAHAGFLGSVIAIEFVFFRYYKGTSIFETLGSLALAGPLCVVFGSRALREVKSRREAELKK